MHTWDASMYTWSEHPKCVNTSPGIKYLLGTVEEESMYFKIFFVLGEHRRNLGIFMT